MSYAIHITVNEPNNIEHDITMPFDDLHEFLDSLLDIVNDYQWTSFVVTVVDTSL